MPKWRGSTIHSDHGRPDGRGNGSPGCRYRRGPHSLRHVQSPRQRDGNHGHRSHREDRREERGLPSAEVCAEARAMSTAAHKTVKLLLADDNPLVRELIVKGLEPVCEVETSTDGADALLKVVDAPPDVILCDYKMPGLDGRQLFEKLRARESTRHIPFLFMASRPDIEERLRPLVDGVEDFIPKPFLIKDLVRITKKVVDRLHLEKLQKKASRPGVIQGRLEEMSMIDLMQSLEMGQKSCRLTVRNNGVQGELYFAGGQCRDAKVGKVEGDDAVYKIVLWTAGEFEIDFNAANASKRTTTTKNTTGLLMEAMRLMDEANRDQDPVATP